jgi:dimeric dUTPase (all-alpha-NTP-PPase superfamily)
MRLDNLMAKVKCQQKQRGIDYKQLTEEQKIKYASECAHALMVEAAELSSSWAFASWKTTSTDIDNIKREIIDCMFFLVNIAECFDITPEELDNKFLWVLDNNQKRILNGEHRRPIENVKSI